MSKIKLPHASGNSVSIAAPQSNPAADRTLYLPSNADGTVLTNTTPGCILQVKQNSDTTTTGTLTLGTADQYESIPNLNVSITPSSSSNKILISFQTFGEGDTVDHKYSTRMQRAISGGATTHIQGLASSTRSQALSMVNVGYYGSDSDSTPTVSGISNYLDSPSTTSAITYTVQIRCHNVSEWNYNRTNGDSNDPDYERGISWITVMEVAA